MSCVPWRAVLKIAIVAAVAWVPAAAGTQARLLSVTLVGKPAREMVAVLAQQEGVALSVTPDLAERKLTVVVENRPCEEVKRHLAEVLGAEWVEVAQGQQLRRTRAVQEWLAAWAAARVRAEEEARGYQADIVRDFVKKAISAADRPLQKGADGSEELPPDVGSIPLAQLLGTLSPKDLDALVRHVGDVSPVREGDAWMRAPARLVMPYRSLSASQRRLIDTWLDAEITSPGHFAAALRDDRQDAFVTFGSPGIGIEVGLYSKKLNLEYRRFAAGASGSPIRIEEALHEALLRLMGAGVTPREALIGATIRADGRITPTVAWSEGTLARRTVSGMSRPPLRQEMLLAVSRSLGLQLIADHHTRSTRLTAVPGNTAGEVLQAAATRYRTVFRQQGPYLLARSVFWPDRDIEETDAPHPESWLASKAAGAALTLADMRVLGGLTDAQLSGLNAYRDGPVDLRLEVEIARRTRWLWGLLPTLSQRQWQATQSKEGLRLRELDLRQRNFIREHVNAAGDWERARLYLTEDQPPDGSGRKGFRLGQIRVPETDQVLWHTFLPPPPRPTGQG